jgi:Ran GTPase-activating protein (RanGAP) involved in mRNA processing and transport
MYYRSLDSYLANPQPRIENNLIKRQTATISERENELKQQIETKNIFYGSGELDNKFKTLENNIMNLLDKKLKILETKIKIDDLKQDAEDESDIINMSDTEEDDTESEDEDDTESEDEDDTDEESEDENEKHFKAKQEKRKQYLKNYHKKYYLANKAKKLKSEL